MNIRAIRLTPGQDIKQELETFVRQNKISAGFVITCVGSLREVTIRMAGARPEAQDIRTLSGDFEIISLVGTVSTGGTHLHISVSDQEGVVTGGHLKEGSFVTTTAEIVIGYEESMIFGRKLDPETGFDELSVS